jgi:hypothetical protein
LVGWLVGAENLILKNGQIGCCNYPMEDVCRICYEGERQAQPLKHPCRCKGSVGGVHESCLQSWINGSASRERCEMCQTPYAFQSSRPIELVEDAQWLCDSVLGNIGPHAFIQYGILAALVSNPATAPIRLFDICLMQVVYHLTFLTLFTFFVRRRLRASWRSYWRQVFNFERTFYLAIYLWLWGYLLLTDTLTPLWIVVDITLQVSLPLFPYFNLQVVNELNAGVQRVLLDYVDE